MSDLFCNAAEICDMGVKILKLGGSVYLGHRRRTQLDEETFSSFNLLPRDQNVGILL